MVQLWFNTWISWVTKPTQVVAESKKPIPAQVKPKFPANKPLLASTNMVWLVNPKREDERVVTNAAYQIAKAQKTGSWFESIMEKYYGTMTDEWFADAKSIAGDLVSGSGDNEMAEAYKAKWFSPEEIKDIHLWFSYVTWIWEVGNDVWNIEWLSTLEKSWIGITAIAWASYWLWKLLDSSGKFIYWLALTNPKDTAKQIKDWKVTIQKLQNEKIRVKEWLKLITDETEISNMKTNIKNIDDAIQIAKDTAPESIKTVWMRTKWAFGSLTRVWTKLEASAEDIAKRYIEPWLKKATEILWKIKTSDIFEWVEKKINLIEKTKWKPYADSLRIAFNDIKNAAVWNKKLLTHQEANAIKSWLYDLMWAKEKAWKIVANVASKAKALLWWEMVWIITNAIKKIDPTLTTLKEYKSYWTRLAAGWMAEKSIAEPWIGNALSTISTVIKAVASPITTTLWKWMNNVWKWLQKLSQVPQVIDAIDWVVNTLKFIWKNKAFIKWKNILSAIVKGWEVASPFLDAVMIVEYLDSHPEVAEKLANIWPDKDAIAKFLWANMEERDKANK